jgi:hypothetical protein
MPSGWNPIDLFNVKPSVASAAAIVGAPLFDPFQVIDDRPANPAYYTSIVLSGIFGATMLRGYTARNRRRACFSTSRLKLVFGNWCASTSGTGTMVPGPNPFEVQACFQHFGTSILDYTPTRVNVTWNNGQKFGTVFPGQLLVSDPCPFQVEAGEAYFLIYSISVPGPNWSFVQGHGQAGGATQTQYALNNGDANHSEIGVEASVGFSATPFNNATGPMTILGSSNIKQRTVALIGDSVIGVSNDGGGGAAGYAWGRRLMMNQTGLALTSSGWTGTTPNFPFIICAKGGDTSQTFASELNSQPGVTLAEMCTTVLWDYGINDVTAATALLPLQSYTLTAARWFIEKGIKFIAATLTPYTTTTDSYSTVANQTVTANEVVRTGYNTWLRDPSSNGFVAMAAGIGAPAWLPSTSYATVGYIVQNGAQCYQVMATGTSGSIGPSGQGANIIDGTVTWRAIASLPGLSDFIDPCVPVEVNSAGAPTLNGGFYGPPPVASDATGTLTSAASSTAFGDTGLANTEAQYNGYSISMTTGTRVDNTQNFQLSYTPSGLASNLLLYQVSLSGTPSIGDQYKIFRPIGSSAAHLSGYGCMLVANYLNTPSILAKFI